ncbi:MAG: hypothetical protein ACJ768_06490 [Gaiellaceae bacterium]
MGREQATALHAPASRDLLARTPGGHPFVPAVFSWLVRGDPGSVHVGEQDILLAAYQYMLDAKGRLGMALPAVFPRAELNGAVRVSEAARLEAAGRSAQDTPEVRAVLWMRRERPGDTYQPLDDDQVLAELLSSYANALSGSGDELDELRRLTRYQVLHELVAAREVADHVEAAEVEERARAYEAPALGRLLQVLLDLDTALALGLVDKLLADSEPVSPP